MLAKQLKRITSSLYCFIATAAQLCLWVTLLQFSSSLSVSMTLLRNSSPLSTAQAMHTLPVWITSLSSDTDRAYEITNLSAIAPIRYRTYHMPNLSDTKPSGIEPIWNETNLIPNQSDTEPIWYQTNMIPNQSDGSVSPLTPSVSPLCLPPSFFPSTYAPLLLLSVSTPLSLPFCISPLYF